jgi:hypothetical protein
VIIQLLITFQFEKIEIYENENEKERIWKQVYSLIHFEFYSASSQ